MLGVIFRHSVKIKKSAKVGLVHKTKLKIANDVVLQRHNRAVLGVGVGRAQLYVASQRVAFWTIVTEYAVLKVLRLAVFFVAIFYMDVNIIGRSSGRSAVGASAYRAGEKLRSNAVKSAAYGSGSKLRNGEIIHDYTKKKGVMHSEIILPDNAPPEYADRETLWNAVEKSEKRKDAQLAREIILALPREFDLSEHIEVTRRYVKENFVNKGMIADFAIHDTKSANPHAHIMLTTRNVSHDGFGLKNTDWNKKTNLLEWRGAWTHTINTIFERKGLDTRIDHRSYREQGIDREPMIHLGHKAAALERQGVKTEKGNHNREVTQRNETRTALNSALGRLLMGQYTTLKEAKNVEIQEVIQFIKEIQQQQQENALQIISALQQQPQNAKPLKTVDIPHAKHAKSNTNTSVESTPSEVRTTLTTAKRVSETQDAFLTPDEKSLLPKEGRAINPNIIKKTKQRRKLRNAYISTYWDLRVMKSSRRMVERENFYFNLDIEEIDEQAKNVQTLLDKVPKLEAERQNQHFWNWMRKKDLDKAIEQAEHDSKKALLYFGRTYHVNPDEIERIIAPIQKKIKANELKIADMDEQISKVEKKFANVKQEFDNYRIEHKIKVRKLVKQLEPPVEPDPSAGRKSVREQMRELRKPEEERKKREDARARREKVKPEKFLVVESGEQRKLSLADVLGKYYRKSNGRTYPSVTRHDKEKKRLFES